MLRLREAWVLTQRLFTQVVQLLLSKLAPDSDPATALFQRLATHPAALPQLDREHLEQPPEVCVLCTLLGELLPRVRMRCSALVVSRLIIFRLRFHLLSAHAQPQSRRPSSALPSLQRIRGGGGSDASAAISIRDTNAHSIIDANSRVARMIGMVHLELERVSLMRDQWANESPHAEYSPTDILWSLCHLLDTVSNAFFFRRPTLILPA